MKKKHLWLGVLAFFTITVGIVAHTNSTILGRLGVDWPDLGYDAGAGLESKIHTAVAKIGDNMSSRYVEFTSVANSGTIEPIHDFDLNLVDLRVTLYSGIGASKTRIQDPVAVGWTIAEKTGDEKGALTITAPGSGGPFDVSVEIHSAKVETEIQFDDLASTPTNPSADSHKVYFKNDTMFRLNSAGEEVEVGSGSGAGLKNYVLNPDAEVNVTSDVTATGMTVAEETAAPLEGVRSFKLTSVAATDNVIFSGSALDEIDENELMTASAWTRLDTGVAGDFTICVYDGSACIASTLQTIPAGKFFYLAQFPTVAGTTYSIRVDADATGDIVVVDDIKLSPEASLEIYARTNIEKVNGQISDWQNNTGLGLTNGYFKWSRFGDKVWVKARYQFSGTGTSGSELRYDIDVINTAIGGTIDFSDLTGISWQGYQVSSGAVSGFMYRAGSNYFQVYSPASSSALLGTNFGASAPDIRDVYFEFILPVIGWQESAGAISNIHRSMLSNSSVTTTGDDTSAFAYGESGQAILAFSSAGNNVRKQVQAQVAAQNSDAPWELVVSPGNNKWIAASSMFPYIEDGSAKYGMKLENIANGTDMYVVFGGDGARQGEAWSTYTSWNWGVRKASAYGRIQAGIASNDVYGLVKPDRYETKYYNGTTSTGNQTLLSFAVVIGQPYILSCSIHISSTLAEGASQGVRVRDGGTTGDTSGTVIAEWNKTENATNSARTNQLHYRTPTYTPTTNLLKIQTFGTATYFGDGGPRYTWCELKEVNSAVAHTF